MILEIDPEPAPDERAALLRALAADPDDTPEPPAWWLAGVREAIEEEPGS